MSDKTDVTVRLEGAGGVHTLLFGKAQDPLPIPKKVTLFGTIDAPAEFVNERKSEIEVKKAHVLVSRQAMQITLVVDETNPLGTEVVGKLMVDPDLDAFCINQNKMFTVKELADNLRLRRQFFNVRSEHERIMRGLGDFSAKTEVEYRDADDRKGNADQSKKRISNIDLELEFILDMPIFKNFDEKTFRVEILAHWTDGGVKLWLESVELAELMYAERETIFDKQLLLLGDYVIIEQ